MYLSTQGGEEQGGMRFYAPSNMQSVKDMPSHTQLKYRQDGQYTAEEIRKRNLRAELEAKERKYYLKSNNANFDEEKEDDLRLLEAAGDGENIGGGFSSAQATLIPKAIDADDEDDEEETDSDEDDDEDEEAELLAELERIKRERAEGAARKAAEAAAGAELDQQAELARGNPLLQDKLAGDGTFAVKRRWDDDVVFKNQARAEPKQQRRFINDTIRSDFHRRFLDRYIK